MHGRWRGQFSITMTDPSALAHAVPSRVDRFAWRVTILNDQLFGTPWLETNVDYRTGAAHNVVVHTTLLRQFGMPVVWGREVIRLDPNGTGFTLDGSHHFPWRWWWACAVHGTGQISTAADSASYVFDYMGTRLTQTTIHESLDVLVVTQQTAFSHGVVRLSRYT